MATKKQRQDDLERFVTGACGYLIESAKQGVSDSVILETLSHDIMGLYRREECFSPRVSYFVKQAREVRLACA